MSPRHPDDINLHCLMDPDNPMCAGITLGYRVDGINYRFVLDIPSSDDYPSGWRICRTETAMPGQDATRLAIRDTNKLMQLAVSAEWMKEPIPCSGERCDSLGYSDDGLYFCCPECESEYKILSRIITLYQYKNHTVEQAG